MSRDLNNVLITDCGSTTTKALLFTRGADRWKLVCSGAAPTTVEEPVADVTVGVLNACNEIQEITGRQLIDSKQDLPLLLTKEDPGVGVDMYLSTSSAGGGLQMLVAGVVGSVSAGSAERAALGAGAIVLDTLSFDEAFVEHEVIERIRELKPDIFLLSGGLEGGAVSQVLELAELILAAAPRPRFGKTFRLPVIYAGNSAAAKKVAKILAPIADVQVSPNLRPEYNKEYLAEAREAIHELFLDHVMSHSPGYDRLLKWSAEPVMPTPSAVGEIVHSYAEETKQNVIAVDIGGATTDVFSVFESAGKYTFNRTVSANLGMSYSIANVLLSAGLDKITRWIDWEEDEDDIADRLRNKMVRPTSIPQSKKDLFFEQAVCREALRLSLEHHKSLATGLAEDSASGGIAGIFTQKTAQHSLIDMLNLDLVIGSGGVLSHAPERLQAAEMLIDGFGLKGLTQIAVDSIFMLPHLGLLSTIDREAASEIFINDCLVNVAHAIVPVFNPKKIKTKISQSLSLVDVFIDGEKQTEVIHSKRIVYPLEVGKVYQLELKPTSQYINIGAGMGNVLTKEITAGLCGLILDGQGELC